MSASNASHNRSFFKNFDTQVYLDEPLMGSNQSEIIYLTLNQTGTRLINTRTDKSIRIWRCFNDRLAEPIVIQSPHLKAVESISWNPKTEHSFGSVGRDELIKLWRINGLLEKEIKVVKDNGQAAVLQIIEYSNDGDVLTVVDRDSTVLFYSATNNYTKLGEIKVSEHIYDLKWFNYKHDYFICALHDGTIPFYLVELEGDAINVKNLHTLKGHRSSAICLSVDPRGRYFACGSNEGIVSIWNTKTMINNRVITSVDEAISHIDISRDGTYLGVTYDSGSNIRIFDYESTDEVYEIPNSLNGNLVLSQIKWFPSKTAFVYTSDNGKTMSLLKRPSS